MGLYFGPVSAGHLDTDQLDSVPGSGASAGQKPNIRSPLTLIKSN